MPYCTQQDMEQRIGLAQLAALTNDVLQVSAPGSVAAVAASGGSLADDTYYYVVTALNEKGETVQSSEVNATTSGSNNTVTVSWAVVSTAKAYRVYRSLTTDTYTTPCMVAQTTSLTYSDTGAVSPLLTGAPTDDSFLPNAGVITSLIAEADAKIDALVGTTYTVPFSTVPQVIKDISVDISCYLALQRRPVNLEMPKSWADTYTKAVEMLEKIAMQEVRLPATATVASTAADSDTSRGAEIDFNDEDTLLNDY